MTPESGSVVQGGVHHPDVGFKVEPLIPLAVDLDRNQRPGTT
jgi:hypothetical protein